MFFEQQMSLIFIKLKGRNVLPFILCFSAFPSSLIIAQKLGSTSKVYKDMNFAKNTFKWQIPWN